MNFSIGTTVGGYEIVGVLGSGGMGEVYRVRNVISDRVDAMKVLLANLQRDQNFATRFLREIKVQARLVHPNIAQLYTAFEHEGNLMMILELVDGHSLLEMLQSGRISLRNAVDYTRQALAALSYAHEQGVIHRDIKPGNIMVTRSGVVKLMDFGIAKAATDRSLTMTGRLVGSLYYMSPEQVRAEVIDHRADLYSVGVVLYQMVTGKKPIDGDSEYAIMRAQIEHVPRPPRLIAPTVPEELSGVIMRSLAKYPAERFQTAEEFRQALEWVSDLLRPEIDATGILDLPPAAPPIPAQQSSTDPGARPERERAAVSHSSRSGEVHRAAQEKPEQPAVAAPVSSGPRPDAAAAPQREQRDEEPSRSRTPLWIGGAVAAAVLVVAATQVFDWMASEPRERPAASVTAPIGQQAPPGQPSAPANPSQQEPVVGSESAAPPVESSAAPRSQVARVPETTASNPAPTRAAPKTVREAPPERQVTPQSASVVETPRQAAGGRQTAAATPSTTPAQQSSVPTQPSNPPPAPPANPGATKTAQASAQSSSPPAGASPKAANPLTRQQPTTQSTTEPAAETKAVPAPAAERVYDPNEVDTQPRLLQQVQPRYTDAAQKAGVQGSVRLQAEIWPDGRAHNIRVVESIGREDLDRNAAVALSLWRFAPGRKDGAAVKVRALIDQTYSLQGSRSAPVLKKSP